MATISITIPDAALPRVRDALCITAGKDSTNANAKLVVAEFVKTMTQQYELQLATQAANAALNPVPDIT